MAATIQISETNGTSPGTVTDGVSNLNFGSTDATGLTTTSYPITPGNNAYEKWIRFKVSSMGTSLKIDNLRVYTPDGTFPVSAGTYLKVNAKTSAYSAATYATPTASTSTVAVNAIAETEPAANLGIGGSLTGSFTAAGYSDYLALQIQTNASDTVGATISVRIRYDEIA